jgi:uncharacterized protein
MHKISIEDIENEGVLEFDFDDDIKELENCHISAEIDFRAMGEFIEAKGHAEGKVTLECDRCLNKFDYNLDFDIDETFAKNTLLDEYGSELELSNGQFVTDLEGAEEIDVYDLLYQSVILALPNKKVCGINCNEGLFVSEDEIKTHDTRMDVFKNIQIEKKG